ncbi:MAG: cyclic nucleotide-binding domain-containing protein [Chloroflexi bacterium]|nr:cyclic nucleotide-binding domain-containing protein [Chloroflexota bacterium]
MPLTGNLLSQVHAFKDLTPVEIDRIRQISHTAQYDTGHELFCEGAVGQQFYVILEGEVDIVKAQRSTIDPWRSETEITLATLRRGQSFGEMALLQRDVRSATARVAQHYTRLMIFHRDDVIELCRDDPELGFRLMANLARDLARKLRTSNVSGMQRLIL